MSGGCRAAGTALTLVLAATLAGPAWAGDKQDFERCDGRMHPGKQDDGLRGMAGTSSYAMRLGGAPETIAACTRALASPRLLPTQTLRRAHLLRARAAAQLQAGDSAAALADLDAATAAAGALAQDRFYARSMGVSLTLLRAIALAQGGDTAGAATLARTAAAARPYSLQVQQVAAAVLQAERAPGSAGASPFEAVMRLNPDAATLVLLREAEIGNFRGVLAARQGMAVDWPTGPLPPLALVTRAPEASRALGLMMAGLYTAYARAATGDPAGAKRELAEVRAHVAALRAPAAAPDKSGTAALASTLDDALKQLVDLRARQIEARVAVAEQRPADAIAALVAAPLPQDAASAELLVALKAALPADKAMLVPDAAPVLAAAAKARQEALATAIPDALIAPETPRAVVDYARARPNILAAVVGGALSMGTSLLGGIERTDGFRSTTNPDGTTKVEFIGNTPSAALVGEMTLLRAAEVARAAGQPAFVITKRSDYTRRLAQMQYGTEISSTPTGFKTELTIRPVAAGTPRALDATAVIDALGPLYYEEKGATPAKRS